MNFPEAYSNYNCAQHRAAITQGAQPSPASPFADGPVRSLASKMSSTYWPSIRYSPRSSPSRSKPNRVYSRIAWGLVLKVRRLSLRAPRVAGPFLRRAQQRGGHSPAPRLRRHREPQHRDHVGVLGQRQRGPEPDVPDHHAVDLSDQEGLRRALGQEEDRARLLDHRREPAPRRPRDLVQLGQRRLVGGTRHPDLDRADWCGHAIILSHAHRRPRAEAGSGSQPAPDGLRRCLVARSGG